MGIAHGPGTARRRLGAELKRFRDEAGMTLEQAAAALECSTSKISRLENGKGLPRQRDVRDLARLYGTNAEACLERLLRLARDGATAGWWQEYTPLLTAEPFVLDGADRYAALEFDASVIKAFDTAVFHGLLQTPSYTRALLSEALPHLTAVELDSLVEFRKARQQVLHREESPLRLAELIDESVLQRLVQGEPDIARDQLAHVLEMAALSNVEVRLLPFSSGFVRALQGPFAVIEFAESVDQDVVFVETHAGAAYLEADYGVDTFKSIFDRALARAVSPADSEKALREYLAALV